MQKTASEQTLTAEQVILAYKALPARERKKVRDGLSIRGALPKIPRATSGVYELYKSHKENAHYIKLRMPNGERVAVGEQPNTIYLLNLPNKPWHLNALFGDETVEEAIRENGGTLDDRTILNLFAENPLPFHIDQTQQYLFMGKSEMDELDFGPLTPIDPIIALARFGLAKMEEANERGYVRL
jgi:hypothetical protein